MRCVYIQFWSTLLIANTLQPFDEKTHTHAKVAQPFDETHPSQGRTTLLKKNTHAKIAQPFDETHPRQGRTTF